MLNKLGHLARGRISKEDAACSERVPLMTLNVRKRKRAAERQPTMKRTARVRYAVVGLGHLAQRAILPAFRQARGRN